MPFGFDSGSPALPPTQRSWVWLGNGITAGDKIIVLGVIKTVQSIDADTNHVVFTDSSNLTLHRGDTYWSPV